VLRGDLIGPGPIAGLVVARTLKLENADVRRIPPQAQEDLRRRVVSAVGRGMSPVEAAEVFGVSTRSVSRWWNAFQRKGSKPRRRVHQWLRLPRAPAKDSASV